MTTGDRAGRIAGAVVFSLLTFVGAFIVATWFRRDFNHDDFFFAYSSWLRASGGKPFRDYYLYGFTVQSEIGAPLFRWFPESFAPLHIARTAVLACIAGLCVVVYRLGRQLGGDAVWAGVSTVVMLCERNVMKRMADIRTDPFAALFLVASALAIRSPLLAGLLWGCAITVGFKVVLSAPFILAAVLLTSVPGRRVRAVFQFGLAAVIAPAVYYGWRLCAEGLAVWLRLWRNLFTTVAAVRPNVASTIARFALESPITAIVLVLGLIGFATQRGRRAGPAGIVYALFALGFIALTLFVNPYIFPYNFTIFVPLLAPVSVGVRFMISSRPLEMLLASAIAVFSVAFAALPMRVIATRSDARQIAFVRWLWRATPPDEHIFDWQGLGFGRPSIYQWWTFTGRLPAYNAGAYDVATELVRYRVPLVIDTFRLRYMKPSDVSFVAANYVRLAPCLLDAGVLSPGGGRSQSFRIFVPGRYRINSETPVTIDGGAYTREVSLTAGPHLVSSARPAALFYMPLTTEKAGPPPCGREPLLYGFN
ncbi:MAG TPA: hypothetical protein VF219_16065 [Vicinamibacterales bacterium]